MGFLKKITRPISRVLDKIVPNEIKPALPFLAAAAPFMAPGIMGAFGNSMLSRGLISGGLNLGSQLAQEGSDGDFSALSLAMASGIGALSAPGTPSTTGPAGPPGSELITTPGQPSAAQFFETKGASMQPGFAKSGLGALESSSNYLTGVGETLRTSPFSKEGLKAALVPVGQGMTDLAVAENRRALKDYEREQADYEAGMDEENSNRAFAIRQSMEAYGFTEQEILDAIEAAGYRAGGRVGLEFGGIPAAVEDVEEKPKEFLVDKLKVTVQPGQSEEMGILNAMFNDVEGVMPDDRKMEFYRLYIPQLYERGEISKEQFEGMKEDILGEGKKDGGRINFDQGGTPVYLEDSMFKDKDYLSMMKNTDKFEGILDLLLKEKRKPSDKEFKKAVELYKMMEDQSADFSDKFDPGDKYTDAKDIDPKDRRPMELLIMEKMLGETDKRISDKDVELGKMIKDMDSGAGGYKDGGLMNLGGREMDMRTGGFIPIGKKERADDVPARLSKNEFVMTADAVRAAGGGSVNKGAKRMYDLMNNLEARV